jgi:hypothetical protein
MLAVKPEARYAAFGLTKTDSRMDEVRVKNMPQSYG